MGWCLHEAAKRSEQRQLLRAQCIAIHQDAREGTLLVRYTAVDSCLVRTEGILGLAKDFGTKARDIYHATLHIIKDFCTASVPSSACQRRGVFGAKFNAKLYEHIKSKIELFDADGAADEQRAARLLRSNDQAQSECLPNLKLILRDRTHAATRSALAHDASCASCFLVSDWELI